MSSRNQPAIVSPNAGFKVCHHISHNLEILILDKHGNSNSKLLPVVKFKIRTLSLCVRILCNLISGFCKLMCLCVVLRTESRAFYIRHKHSTTELHTWTQLIKTTKQKTSHKKKFIRQTYYLWLTITY